MHIVQEMRFCLQEIVEDAGGVDHDCHPEGPLVGGVLCHYATYEHAYAHA